ncbi:RNA polymerase subunit sigma-70 [Actinophytocola sp.]|uniref:RNA polymerase subunit sigma-70 n=1 Tax=Actinophytocola sp. TaxID=1872138 RepID=UPI0025C348C6|nr:RNA polymerase subunit sigma-70 [Actinophytocola sp.]
MRNLATDEAVIAAATSGDEYAFARLAQRHRRELHVHSYRMLGNFEDAEDVVQETLVRAWRARAGFVGTGFRAWLYKIATNACLDTIRRKQRRVPRLESFAEVPWLQPYPDHLLDQAAPADAEPDATVVARETIELAFLAAIQLLPAQQRAILILREVLDWSAKEVAELLETTVAGVNSALQRARATLRTRLPERDEHRPVSGPTDVERSLLDRYVDAHQRGDMNAFADLVRDDIRITMPPQPLCYDGVASLAPLMEAAFGGSHGDWLLVPTSANRQLAAANYLRAPGDDTYRAFKIDVVRFAGDRIAEVTTFDKTLFDVFGLPPTMGGPR